VALFLTLLLTLFLIYLLDYLPVRDECTGAQGCRDIR
jgi:hypothetical protein